WPRVLAGEVNRAIASGDAHRSRKGLLMSNSKGGAYAPWISDPDAPDESMTEEESAAATKAAAWLDKKRAEEAQKAQQPKPEPPDPFNEPKPEPSDPFNEPKPEPSDPFNEPKPEP